MPNVDFVPSLAVRRYIASLSKHFLEERPIGYAAAGDDSSCDFEPGEDTSRYIVPYDEQRLV
jgi:hypothetical protein